jgi:hypothetical protein
MQKLLALFAAQVPDLGEIQFPFLPPPSGSGFHSRSELLIEPKGLSRQFLRRHGCRQRLHGPLNVTQRVAKLAGQVLPYGSRLDRLAPTHRPQPFGRVDRLDVATHQPDFGHVAVLQALPVLSHVLR